MKNRRRRKLLQSPFPDTWRKVLERDVAFYPGLDDRERTKLQDDLRVFMAEKSWEGCGGLTLSDVITVGISAQACLLVLNRSLDEYDHVRVILVYPEAYWAPSRQVDASGVVTEGLSGREGEAWSRGTVVLSWADAREGGRMEHDGRNLVFHEFAHQLDMADHVVDGTPILDDRASYERWTQIMSAEYERLQKALDVGADPVLDPYGATNEAEFFAVATETFFERPVLLRSRRPALYELLLDYYRQDPASRLERTPI